MKGRFGAADKDSLESLSLAEYQAMLRNLRANS
jgi:hypothetical protein